MLNHEYVFVRTVEYFLSRDKTADKWMRNDKKIEGQKWIPIALGKTSSKSMVAVVGIDVLQSENRRRYF